jgi:hypothetical protein
VKDKWLTSVVMYVNDEDTYADDGVYSDKGVVAYKLDKILGRAPEFNDAYDYELRHIIKYKLHNYGVAYENVTVSDGEDSNGQWVVLITFDLVGAD